MTWNINDAPLPSRGFVRIEHFCVEVARVYKTGRAKYYGLGMLPKETQDNARLISAAPDLLEALKGYVGLCGNTAYMVDREGLNHYWELAMKAITKAEGAE